MKHLLSSILIFLIPTITTAQISYKQRIEFEVKDGYEQEQIYEVGKNGVIIRSVSEDKKKGKYEWKFEHLDNSLNSTGIKLIDIDKDFSVDETFKSNDYIHTLMRDKKNNFIILTVNTSNLEITQTTGKLPQKSYISEMAVSGDYAYFNATIKGLPFLFTINWKSGVQKPIPVFISGVSPKKITLKSFQLLNHANEVFLYASARESKKTSNSFVIILNNNGEKIGVMNFSKDIKENLVDISAYKLGNEQYIFTGTYSNFNTDVSSEGIFFCKYQGGQLEYISFHKYLDLKNFLSYLSDETREKIEKKKARKEERGKEFTLNYRISMHDIIVQNDGYLFLGEAYYPTYRTEYYLVTTTVNGVTTTRTESRQVFDGYQYTHAVIVKFDKQGKYKWDQTFHMWPAYKPYYPKLFISVIEQDKNAIKMAFSSYDNIISKSINSEGQIINDKKSNSIDTEYSGDKTKFSFSYISYWYDNYFIVHGLQKIKNKENENVKRKRTVYFINKIAFE